MNHFKSLFVISMVLLSALLESCSDNSKTESRPNILVLISDDQRWDQVSYPGNQVIAEFETPNLDRLASGGIYFTNAFVTTPICAVSRACIMTGRYASSHGMNHFNTPLEKDVRNLTYPALLKEAGYRTGILGKWGMGMEGTEEIFDVCEAWYHQGPYFHNTDSGIIHNSEWLATKASDFFKSHSGDKPFCLTVCYKSPHHPYQPDYRDSSLFEEVEIPERLSDTPEAYSAMPAHIMDSSLNRWCYFDERKDEETRNNFEKDFLRCVISLDRSIGKIMSSLKEYKLDDNTVVVFLSDHGYLWGEHGLGGKWLLYEESIRIPMIISSPGIPDKDKGKLAPANVLNIDIAPTILELAGLEVPELIDGKSLAPLLSKPGNDIRNEFFMEHAGIIDVENPIPDSYGVRSSDWKYIRYINAEPEVEELYYLKNDPYEIQNLATQEKHLNTLAHLRKLCDDYLGAQDKE